MLQGGQSLTFRGLDWPPCGAKAGLAYMTWLNQTESELQGANRALELLHRVRMQSGNKGVHTEQSTTDVWKIFPWLFVFQNTQEVKNERFSIIID